MIIGQAINNTQHESILTSPLETLTIIVTIVKDIVRIIVNAAEEVVRSLLECFTANCYMHC